MRRNLLRTCCLLTLIALLALPGAALGSSNNAPSKAVNVQVGKPFAGAWAGTIYKHGDSEFTHWWRLPSILRPGDQVQVAVDNQGSNETLYLCLVPPVDDFSADVALEGCRKEYVLGGQQSRVTLTHEGVSGQAFLVTSISECCYERGEAAQEGDGQYAATIERITSLVNIGMAVPSQLPSTFILPASVVYGDGTPAADGTPAVLQWRPVAIRGTDPAPFADLVYSTSVGGGVTFTGAMPVAAQGQKVQLRACVAQPGGVESRCGVSGRTLVAESPCSRALDNQLVLSRVVRRLAKHVRRLRAGPAKIRLKRKLKAKKRKRAKANRSVKIHCG